MQRAAMGGNTKSTMAATTSSFAGDKASKDLINLRAENDKFKIEIKKYGEKELKLVKEKREMSSKVTDLEG
jgi:hypothetical protein